MKIRCICPPKGDAPRHPDGDTVNFRDTLPLHGAMSIVNDIKVAKALDARLGIGEIIAILTQGYLLHGIESWTVVDAKGQPVDCDKPAIRELILDDSVLAMELGDVADDIYAGQVMLPLLQRALNFSLDSSTDESTSPTSGEPSSTSTDEPPSSPKARKRSRPSSITSIPTAATATTSSSLDGDSNLSPSSKSAA